MNGEYELSSTPGGNNTQRLFPTHYHDYPDDDIVPTESFDVYSPIISQLYSQVFWKGLPPVRLPQYIIDKYRNKGMAVIGFEIDQVMLDNNTGAEISIPINAVYNHHFESTMIGGSLETRFELASPQDPRVLASIMERNHLGSNGGHGIPPHQPYWLVVGDMVSVTGLPVRQDFGGANGGEMRQSFHGYAPGFAQLIESPRELQITPMQIDTWHRDLMPLYLHTRHFLTPPKFVAGPLPRSSKAPRNATYSGLLECPLTTRITKHVPPQGSFRKATGTCSGPNKVTNANDCYRAVVAAVRESDTVSQIVQESGRDPRRPNGCTLRSVLAKNNGSPETIIQAYYNTISEETTQVNESDKSTVACGGSSKSTLWSATATSLVNVSITMDPLQDLVTMALTGPLNVWFGVGFGARAMSDQPWTIVVSGSGDDVRVTELVLKDHAAGNVVSPTSLQVQSIHVTANERTVILTRSIRGRHFTFETHNVTEIPFINAIGSSSDYSYHKSKEVSTLLVLPVATSENDDAFICLCQKNPPQFGYAQDGELIYHPVTNQAGERGVTDKVLLRNQCEPSPRSDLLDQKNPTCDIRTYEGGQTACHHMWSLLDADQEIPWPDVPIEYRLKFRFWVQPYEPTYHTNVRRVTLGIASPTEYDVPKCAEGVPGCSFEVVNNEVSGETKHRWVHTIRGTFQANKHVGRLVAAHFHCHAPTCLRTALYLCDDDVDGNQQGCNETTGTLLCQQDTVQSHGEKERFHEAGFIHQPPCLWGDSRYGLEPPVNVKGRTLFAIKTADATYGHTGEMAWLQMYYF